MNYLKSNFIFFLFFLIGYGLHAQNTQSTIIYSPDKLIAMQVMIKDSRIYYTIDYRHHPVIQSSLMELKINNQITGNATGIKSVVKTVINETYPYRGVHSRAVNYCNFAVISLTGRGLVIEAKVFNDGVAFRYRVAEKDSSGLNADNTGFAIPSGSKIWSQNDISYYEGQYKQQRIEDVKNGQLAGPPVTIKLPDNQGYVAITEGGVINFAGMSLIAGGNNTFKANLVSISLLKGEIVTPWRIVEIGKNLNTLVNCDIIANVSAKTDKSLFPDGFATEWIKSGKSVWSWLSGSEDVSFENMKKYSKLAGELGIPYNLVDEGWGYWKDTINHRDAWEMMKELVDYSAKQNVKVWVWKAYPDRKNIIGLKNPEARMEFFDQCKRAGVAGIKIDFFDAETQEVMNFYKDALIETAKLHLMIDFHGANKPTGQSRTWPNEMTREGIRGLEYGKSVPSENTTLPFTRFLAGHADNSPFTLRNDMMNGTTLTHQVATLITFTSPFMCLAVNPEALLISPVKKFVSELPTTWDETIVLPQSEIGELAVYARRKGIIWYLSVLNGENQKTIKINLSFLKKGIYSATLLKDDKSSLQAAEIIHKNYSSESNIPITLRPGGGFAAKFSK